MRLLPGKLPDAPQRYNSTKFNLILRTLQQALRKPVQSKIDAETEEALNWFLSK